VTTLQYTSFAEVDTLSVGQCTMHRCAGQAGEFWHLWFRVERDDNRQPVTACVPVNPNGSYNANGRGGKTWGLTKTAPGTWQFSPSINVLESEDVHPGEHPTEKSIWHQTPAVAGVPDGESWTKEAP